MSEAQPETVAGRELLADHGYWPKGPKLATILAIEAEARADLLTELRTVESDLRLVVRQLREEGYHDWPDILERVLALLEPPR